MGDTQKTLVDLQWHSESESAKLEKLLGSTSVDEKAALAQADKVMAIETQMKRTHLGLLLHIKNLLTAAQQTKLRSLRPKGANSAMPMPPPGE
jgi:Spy/CpxP family protein refolding chaperone